MKRFSAREKAIAWITGNRIDWEVIGGSVLRTRYAPAATHQASESHWWVVEDAFGSMDQFLGRRIALWHVFEDDGMWFIRCWIGSEITRTDCPEDLRQMVRMMPTAANLQR